ncbi:MAG: hypothetical protein K9I29_09595 [Bacteroidales bacterium]|nr:hypothetical protein [Bacteroidales bacterium]MCF8328532.1 hypothetical protein [Bacteroidales bacterium]
MKSRQFRLFILLILFLILSVLIYFSYIWFQETHNRSPYSVIPDDAIFVLHTNNFSKAWEESTESDFWKSLKETERFAEIDQSVTAIDTIIKNNKTVARLLENRPILISAHMTSTYDYKSLITVDLREVSKIAYLKDFALPVLKAYGYDYSKMTYNKNELIQVSDKDKATSFYISFIDNLMIVSFNEKLIKHTLDKKDNATLADAPKFNEVRNQTSQWSTFRVFFNYNKLEDFIRVYQNPAQYKAITDGLKYADFSGFDLNISDHNILLEGQTSLDIAASDLMKDLNQINPGKPAAFKILPQNTALYLSFTFRDFNNFQNVLEKQYKLQDSLAFNNYKKRVEQINKLLNINIEDYLTSWIGNEIAFLKLQANQKTKIKNSVLCLQAQDITQAENKLAELNEQVRKKLPAGFESKNYHGYPVYYLNINGLFRFFFSDLLSRIDKPYYTFINDYVVFSNNISDIYRMIDAYIVEETLLFNEEFMDFTSSLNNAAPLSIYVQTPETMKFLYSHANTRTKTQLEKNKEVITAFSRAGIQFIPASGNINTNIAIQHDPYGLYKMNLRQMESATTELYSITLKSKDFNINIPEKQSKNSTFLKLHYDESDIVKASGKLKRGTPDGNWRFYYPNGNIEAVVHYDKGTIDGKAYFYYNSNEQNLRCEAQFSDGELDGLYKEFYKNGKSKATLQFKNNQRHGDADFYYPGGELKIEAKFKRGSKKGKWKYYTPDGKEYDRKYWRSKH